MSRIMFEREVDALIDTQRARALWFVRDDWYPSTDEERRRALDQIQRRADRETFVRAGELKKWLLLDSKNASVGS